MLSFKIIPNNKQQPKKVSYPALAQNSCNRKSVVNLQSPRFLKIVKTEQRQSTRLVRQVRAMHKTNFDLVLTQYKYF